MSSGRRTTSTAGLPVGAAMASLLAARGSFTGPGSGGETPVAGQGTHPGFGWFGPVLTSGNPGDAVERAGLVWPAGAVVNRTEYLGLKGRAEAYVFTFTVDAVAADALCQQEGFGGPGPAVAIPAPARGSLGGLPLTSRSRWCEGSPPGDPKWLRYLLVDGGDPTTVHLALERLP